MGGEKPLALYTTVGRRRGEAYLVEKRVEMMMIKMELMILMGMVIMMHGNTTQYKQTSKQFFSPPNHEQPLGWNSMSLSCIMRFISLLQFKIYCIMDMYDA